jgi:membrane protein implicated in regulation of membrane protease activity
MNPAILLVRILQISFIVSVLLFIVVLKIIHPAPHSVSASIQWSIVFCAIASALAGFYAQKRFRRLPSQPLSSAQSPDIRSPWLAGHVIRFATAESVALFGVVLRMMGSTSILVTVLFVASLLLLLLWQPGAAPTETKSQNTIG